MGFALDIADGNFELLETSDRPVLVDFWSPSCGACKMIGPAIESLAEDYLGRVWVAKAQAEKNPVALGRFGINKLPSLVMFKNGQEVDRIVGSVRWDTLNGFIERHAA